MSDNKESIRQLFDNLAKKAIEFKRGHYLDTRCEIEILQHNIPIAKKTVADLDISTGDPSYIHIRWEPELMKAFPDLPTAFHAETADDGFTINVISNKRFSIATDSLEILFTCKC